MSRFIKEKLTGQQRHDFAANRAVRVAFGIDVCANGFYNAGCLEPQSLGGLLPGIQALPLHDFRAINAGRPNADEHLDESVWRVIR